MSYNAFISCVSPTDLVVKQLRLKSEPDCDNLPEMREVTDSLTDLMDKVKDIAINTKKSAATVED